MNFNKGALKNWRELERDLVSKNIVFEHWRAVRQNPRNGHTGDFHFLHTANWVQVVCLTDQEDFLFVRQFRHGSESFTLECVAGALKSNEDPLVGAKRELREELGAQAQELELLEWLRPNPALFNNWCAIVLAKGCQVSHEVRFDALEDIESVLLSKEEVIEAIKKSHFEHALTHNALSSFFLRELMN